MALNAAMVWEVRTTGSDNNGGGFKTGATGTDHTLQDAAFATLTAASKVHSTTTQINVAAGDYTVAAGDVGNVLQITGGTATAGFYEITVADTANNRWTLDRSAGTNNQSVVGAMGGAMLSPGKIAGVVVAGNIVFIKSGTYSITTASTNVAAGCIATAAIVTWSGYNTTRTVGNTDTRPVLQINVTTATIVTGTLGNFINITFDGNTQTSSKGFSGVNSIVQCHFTGFTNSAINAAAMCKNCSFTACTTTAVIVSAACVDCEAYANTVTPFQSSSLCIRCIAYANTGATTDGFSISGVATWLDCTSYNNGRDGFRWAGGNHHLLVNCYAETNAGFGFNSSARTPLINSGAYNNTSGATTGTVDSIGFITPTASVFTNAAGNDFSLNNTASAGALLRNAGYPTTFLRGTTPTYLDVGAARHQDPSSSAGPIKFAGDGGGFVG